MVRIVEGARPCGSEFRVIRESGSGFLNMDPKNKSLNFC